MKTFSTSASAAARLLGAVLLLAPSLKADVPVASVAPLPAAVLETTGQKPTAETATVAAQEGLNAMVWVQSSAEAKIAARQAYFLATRQLDVALKDRKWSAAVEQGQKFGKLPPAIILDLDETVLDNSPFQARLVRDDALYSGAAWASWAEQADAKALPGAAEFLKYAASKGVQIFYISNRDVAQETATRRNLTRLSLPVQGPADHVLLAGEQPDWTNDKTTRRAFVAKSYRVLLLVGDDLNDFVSAKPMTLQQRLDLYQKYAPYWGQRWILLSNPLYGSWEGALFDYRHDLSRQEMLQRKYNALQTDEPISAPAIPATSQATR